MLHIKTSFTLTVIWSALLFNYEHLVPNDLYYPSLNLILFTLIIVENSILLFLPKLGRQWLASELIFLLLYTAACLFMGKMGNYPYYPYLLGAGMMTINTLVVTRISDELDNFDQATQKLLIGEKDSCLLPKLEGEEKVNYELYCARRFDRPIAFVYCEMPKLEGETGTVEVATIKWEITQSLSRRYRQAQLIRWIGALTYKSDVVVEYHNGVIICLPETNKQEAENFVHGLETIALREQGIVLRIGVAVFPEDGLVFDNLAQSAHQNATPKNGDKITHSEPPVFIRKGAELVDIEQRFRIEQLTEWIGHLPALNPHARSIYHEVKSLFDRAIALLLMPVLLPVITMISLVIFLDDQHNPFFVQWRTGYGGKRFKMVKFRTMHVDAEAVPAHAVLASDGSIHNFWPEKSDYDTRITRVGHILRKTSLDELPQLWNIFRGDMNFVGPRPTSWDVDLYTSQQTERLTVRPGITGLWQVSARHSTNMDERLLWDLKYIENMNPWLDMAILWRTVAQVFKRKGT